MAGKENLIKPLGKYKKWRFEYEIPPTRAIYLTNISAPTKPLARSIFKKLYRTARIRDVRAWK